MFYFYTDTDSVHSNYEFEMEYYQYPVQKSSFQLQTSYTSTEAGLGICNKKCKIVRLKDMVYIVFPFYSNQMCSRPGKITLHDVELIEKLFLGQ